MSPLSELARLYGVQTSYSDIDGRRRRASRDALLAALRALGAPVERERDVEDALRVRRGVLCRRMVEPVVVAWTSRGCPVDLRLPAADADRRLECRLELEDGGVRSWTCDLGELAVTGKADVDGASYVTKRTRLPRGLPAGYHRLLVGEDADALVIATPGRCPAHEGLRTWGVFLPLYALRTARSWGAGDVGGLEALVSWTAELGGGVVQTLPLHAGFMSGVEGEDLFDPSPYAPASRLYWNELYADVAAVPEIARSREARELCGSLAGEREALSATDAVAYERVAALKRRVLEPCARALYAEAGDRLAAVGRFVDACPGAEDYARFRAACERHRAPWTSWPEPLRSGTLRDADVDADVRRYHLYAQWIIREQLEGVRRRFDDSGPALALDMPLGVHPWGYDVWRHRDAFATGATAGAPPDAFFAGGQDWGFPPLHPEGVRDSGYAYPVACLREVLRYAGVLRIDHVMGFHRLYWIPDGVDRADGVYVRYPSEEWYAILALEASRSGALVVGEDLGTVPDGVRRAMDRHGVRRMWVGRFEDRERVPDGAVASVGTHDMPPFAAWSSGEPLGDYLRHMASSDASIVLVSIEDLWGETEPQNVPGTREGNWRRKARYTFEQWGSHDGVVDTLREIDGMRRP
jgi:4-alpha-glucanotransferase